MVRELHASTASDLDKQLTEFTRCAAMMKKAIRHAEFKNNELRTKMAKEKDEVLEEVMAKYEALSGTQIETDKQLSEKSREVQRLQDEFEQNRRTKTKKSGKVLLSHLCMTEMKLGVSAKASDTRSESHVVFGHPYSERHSTPDSLSILIEIRRSSGGEFTGTEAVKKWAHDIRRLTDRLQAAEEEKTMKETMLNTIQNTLATTHRTHKEFIENLMSSHRDELADRDKKHESDLEERISEVWLFFGSFVGSA
ncbi:hypothetical protein COOONC_17137 [Cooperia oncophora]